MKENTMTKNNTKQKATNQTQTHELHDSELRKEFLKHYKGECNASFMMGASGVAFVLSNIDNVNKALESLRESIKTQYPTPESWAKNRGQALRRVGYVSNLIKYRVDMLRPYYNHNNKLQAIKDIAQAMKDNGLTMASFTPKKEVKTPVVESVQTIDTTPNPYTGTLQKATLTPPSSMQVDSPLATASNSKLSISDTVQAIKRISKDKQLFACFIQAMADNCPDILLAYEKKNGELELYDIDSDIQAKKAA